MRKLLIILILLLISSSLYAEEIKASVIAVTDGDTIKVSIKGKIAVVRISGIDCPEMNQPYGSVAKQATHKMLFGRTVLLQVKSKDKYSRYVAKIITLDKKDVGLYLIKSGLAWWYKKYDLYNWKYQQLEKVARYAKIGIWSQPAPIPPWQWRNS